MNKGGISEIVSYVLLIVISMAIATLVFTFLKAYVPKQNLECKEGVSLIVEKMTCANDAITGQNILQLSLENRGLFKIDKVYLRIGKEGRKFKADIPQTNPVTLLNEDGKAGLNPGEISDLPSFSLLDEYSVPGTYIIEIQPAYITVDKPKGPITICPPITEPVTCS